MARANKCLVCSPKICAPHWLYVVEDPSRGLSKIGISRAIAARLSTYRKRGSVPDVILHVKLEQSCEFRALILEEKAHRRMDKKYRRVRGDWYDAPVAASIAALKPISRGNQI